ncbi:hypothetical protein, conserved [Eimeria tenella]|uniref:Btz domain-containing protein n=1 Tax=Eimeria tenella TaxID=5802 RepID=U6KVZ3_EIMTE|nr:hypothetical protein, conserved [Eimeria tenella]CDJ42307.1 hypothetical protein, conserved [Eimeria tenella]|eukprot:XP_013233057.1 hypothetical protein, conserved [Eimeria tenella]
MGNPRHLRRASSQDEDEGDVFDDKSEISSGSDEEAEEATRDAAATGGDSVGSASAVQATTSASPSSAGAAEASRAASSDPKASKESPKTPENEQTAGNEAARDEGKHRRSASSGDGFRARPKSTWQLMQEDPSYVPRATRYFLHDDRRDDDSSKSEASDEHSESQPDTRIPRSTQTRVGSSKKLWTPDENEGEWKHDMWEQLQKEEAGERPNFSNWNRGRRPGRRGGSFGYRRGGQVDSWVPRGSRGGRTGGNGSYRNEPWRGEWRPRGRSRAQDWSSERQKQYVPRQSAEAA